MAALPCPLSCSCVDATKIKRRERAAAECWLPPGAMPPPPQSHSCATAVLIHPMMPPARYAVRYVWAVKAEQPPPMYAQAPLPTRKHPGQHTLSITGCHTEPQPQLAAEQHPSLARCLAGSRAHTHLNMQRTAAMLSLPQMATPPHCSSRRSAPTTGDQHQHQGRCYLGALHQPNLQVHCSNHNHSIITYQS